MYSHKNIAYVLTSLVSIEKLKLYTVQISDARDFLQRDDQLIYNACLTLLMTLGEETSKIDEALKDAYPQIPWISIKGIRNRIAHDYRGYGSYHTVQCDYPPLDPLREVRIDMISKIDYPKRKLLEILESDYYKHVRYLGLEK